MRSVYQLGKVFVSGRSANQFLVDGVANVDRGDFDWGCRSLTVKSRAANKEETPVVVDITPVARSTLATIADPHAYGSLFVGGVPAPVRFPANTASTVFGNSAKTTCSVSLLLPEVADGQLLDITNVD
jgi:hypothetical protein